MAEPNEIPTEKTSEHDKEIQDQSEHGAASEEDALGHLVLETESPKNISTPRAEQDELDLPREPASDEEGTEPSLEAGADVSRGEEEVVISQSPPPEDLLTSSASHRSVSARQSLKDIVADKGESSEETVGEFEEEYEQSEATTYSQQIDAELPEIDSELSPSDEQQETSLSDVKYLESQPKSLTDASKIEQEETSLSDATDLKQDEVASDFDQEETSPSGFQETEEEKMSLLDVKDIEQEEETPSYVIEPEQEEMPHLEAEEIEQEDTSLFGADEMEQEDTSLLGTEEMEQEDTSFLDTEEMEQEETYLSDALDIEQVQKSTSQVIGIEKLQQSVLDATELAQRQTSLSDIKDLEHEEKSISDVKEIKHEKKSISDVKGMEHLKTSLLDVREIKQEKTSLSDVRVSEEQKPSVVDVKHEKSFLGVTEVCSEVESFEEEQIIYCRLPAEDSLVYTSTPKTIFEQEPPTAGTDALNMTWAFGINSNLPVFNLHDEDQKVIVYFCAHTTVLHDFNLNQQRHLQGHCSSISCVCVSEDRRWIATADKGPESLILIWDTFSGIPVRTIFDSHPEGGVVAIAMSSNAKYLATIGGGTVQRVSIWNWTTSEEHAVSTVELSTNYGQQSYIIFNPLDHTQLISNSASQVIFYAWEDTRLEYSAPSLTNTTFNKAVGAFSQSVFYLETLKALTATSAGKFVVWDTIGPKSFAPDPSLRPHQKRALKLMPVQEEAITVLTVFDRYFVTGDEKGQIKFFDDQLEIVHWYGNLNLGPVYSISFSKSLPTPASQKTKYPTDSTLKGQQFAVSNFVVSTSDATVLHVSTNGTKLKKLMQEPYEVVPGLACHPSQPLLAIGSYSGILKVWDYKEKNQFVSRIFERGLRLHCLTYNIDGSLLAVGCTNGSVYILDSLTLEDECPEPFQYARGTITHMSFSYNSQYLATADVEYTVTLFKQVCKGEDPVWEFFGRLRSHYKPIQTLIFGINVDCDEARLLSLGMDRNLVEYDLSNSTKGNLQILSTDRIEQSAIPKCLAWYPPITKESFIVTSNDQFKMKLYNATTKMCRKTVLGPTYGSPLRKMEILPRKDIDDPSKGYLAYITDDKVGLQMLPVDGNPHTSSALICHPAGVANLVCSCDGAYVFTAGGKDCTVLMWETNLQALEAAASLGGHDLVPFYGLLDGGRDGEFFREMEDYFYYALLRSQGVDTMEPRQVSTRIPLKEVPFIMRALGFYPTEQEIEDMLNEVKFSEYVNTGKQVTDINLDGLLRLYCNHRPAFGIAMAELQQAFKVLGMEDENGEWAMDRGQLLYLLQTQGEHMTEEELAEHLTTLIGLNPEGGSSENESYDATGSAVLLEQEIPQTITSRMFATEILGLPVPSPQEVTYEDSATNMALTADVC
ncbi:cilia- and flagella-associated protein 251 [Lissotriton helveticus]